MRRTLAKDPSRMTKKEIYNDPRYQAARMLAAGWLYVRGVQTVRAQNDSDDDASHQTR